MRTLAILPVKSFGAAKQRLADGLGAGARQALAQAMVSDVLTSLRRTPGLDGIVVVTADRAAEAAASGGGVRGLRDTARAWCRAPAGWSSCPTGTARERTRWCCPLLMRSSRASGPAASGGMSRPRRRRT